MTQPTLSFADTVRARRSFRAFHSTPVADDLIAEALQDAQYAPSNCNTQPWQVHVVSGATRDALSLALHAANREGRPSPDFSWDEGAFTGRYLERHREHGKLYYENLGVAREDRQRRNEAAAVNFSFFHAPHVALLFMPVFGDSVRVAGDLGMYGQTFLLALAARGLGGVPQTVLGLYADTVREVLIVPQEFKLLFGISFGYPDEGAPGNLQRVGRDPVSANVILHR
ncbi:nitroreductase [Brevundimonas intermedia]|uniref:nitroreductase n=1 Tax=Brevundimonas intermedia TaxID=74315 RepID=UPI003207C20B